MSTFIVNSKGLQTKYGSSSGAIAGAISALGPTLEVSGLSSDEARAKIAGLASGEPACLIGGYDLIPPYIVDNPSKKPNLDDDVDVPTDAAYGATPGVAAEAFAPRRAIARIPDPRTADVDSFLVILRAQAAATGAPTPVGAFEMAAAEFNGAAALVHNAIPGVTDSPRLSPPDDQHTPGLVAAIAKRGRLHVLLHGANFDPEWAWLFGHEHQAGVTPYIEAVSAMMLGTCDLNGSIVTFSSCYAAMLDTEPAASGERDIANQVALACLAAGAKVVFAATRSNWINTRSPYQGFGPSLTAEVWNQLGNGVSAAEALRLAKREYLRTGLAGGPGDQPYVLKTVLQAQCYGHPDATL